MADQFAPITKPYLKMWQDRIDADKLAKAIKAVKKRKGKKAKVRK